MPAAEGRGSKARGGRKPTQDELDLWEQFTRDVKPLPGEQQARVRPTPKARQKTEPPASPGSSPQAAPPSAFNPPAEPKRRSKSDAPLSPGSFAGVDRRTADRLRRGQMQIDGRIDLHGMTRQAAHGALANYIHRAADRGLRCIIVITGKGSAGGEAGVLRREVPHWLNQPDLRPRIVSFVQAQPRHGGAGALYVLLRRRRDG